MFIEHGAGDYLMLIHFHLEKEDEKFLFHANSNVDHQYCNNLALYEILQFLEPKCVTVEFGGANLITVSSQQVLVKIVGEEVHTIEPSKSLERVIKESTFLTRKIQPCDLLNKIIEVRQGSNTWKIAIISVAKLELDVANKNNTP